MRKNMFISIISLVVAFMMIPFPGNAQVPKMINYQGYLTDTAGNPVNGSVSMTFAIYDVATGGSALWSEIRTVTVDNGRYSVNLGAVNPLNLAEAKPYYLGVQVGTDPEMTPRKELTSAMYSLFVDGITIKDGKVGVKTENPTAMFHVNIPEADNDNGAVILGANDGVQKNFRFLNKFSVDGYSYFQVGASPDDTNAKLRVSRFGSWNNLAEFRVSTDNFVVDIPENSGAPGNYGSIVFGRGDGIGSNFRFLNKFSDGYSYFQVGTSKNDAEAKLRFSRFATSDNLSEFRISANKFEVNIPENKGGPGNYGEVVLGPGEGKGNNFRFLNKFSDGYSYFQVGASPDDTSAKLRISLFASSRNLFEFRVSATQSVFDGKVLASEIVVKNSPWADFVFDDQYELMPLSEVEQHIKADKHLPGIPTAQEVEENGVSVGDMQAKLLQKIEELTLHLIEQDKKLSALQQENEMLREELSGLKEASMK